MVGLLFTLSASPALAGGYYYADSGIVAMGRGGAWVAGADTQYAQHYNPAGLIKVPHPTVNFGWSGVQQDVKFTRQKPEGGFYAEQVNQGTPFSVPQIGAVLPIRDDLTVAMGFYSPFAPSYVYDEEGPQRYTIIDSLVYKFTVGPSVAWRPFPELTIGASVGWDYFEVGELLDISWTSLDDPGGDINVEARVVDPFTFNYNAGVLIEPVEELSIGLSFLPPIHFRAKGFGKLDFRGNSLDVALDPRVYRDEDVALLLDMPLVLRGGVAVRPIEGLELETAVVYERWSSLADIRIEEVDVRLEGPGLDFLLPDETDRDVDDTFVLPAGLIDTWSLRLGGEWRINEAFEPRLGAMYETTALGPEDVSVALYDTNKLLLGSGLSLHLLDERLRIDGVFSWIFFQSLEVRESTVTIIDAGAIDHGNPELVVGNGDYSSNGWILGGQANWVFKKKEE